MVSGSAAWYKSGLKWREVATRREYSFSRALVTVGTVSKEIYLEKSHPRSHLCTTQWSKVRIGGYYAAKHQPRPTVQP